MSHESYCRRCNGKARLIDGRTGTGGDTDGSAAGVMARLGSSTVELGLEGL